MELFEALVDDVDYKLSVASCAGDTFTIFTALSEYMDWVAATMDLLPPPAL